MINIYSSMNEWKESTNYLFAKWFGDLNKKVEQWFDTEMFQELEFDYFEFDSNHFGPIYIGFIYFNENEIEWKLEIILDSTELDNDDTIDNINIKLIGYNKKDKDNNILLGELNKDIKESELTSDFIIEIINDFKTQYINID